MDNVLIASATSATLGIISDLLKANPPSRIITFCDGASAKRFLLEGDADLVIIDTPLSDELGSDLALRAVEHSSAGVILLVDLPILYDVNAITEGSEVFVLPKPVSPMFFYQACTLLLACKAKIKKLQEQNQELLCKIEELRLVSRAKCLLVEKEKVTEAQAHHFIQKRAMSSRQSLTEVAKTLIRAYS